MFEICEAMHPSSDTHPAVRRAYSLGWAYCFYESRADGKFRFVCLSVRDGKRETCAIEAETITEAVEQLVP